MIPRGSVNVLSAGRTIDANEGAFGEVRVMVNCMQTGQAAGVAAHVALETGKHFAEVPVERLHRLLEEQGAIVRLLRRSCPPRAATSERPFAGR
jgi:hypothetical protein